MRQKKKKKRNKIYKKENKICYMCQENLKITPYITVNYLYGK